MLNGIGQTPLMLAASEGHVDVVDILIKKGALLDIRDENDGSTALHLAANHNRALVVQSLLDHHADTQIRNIYGKTAALLAVNNGYNGLPNLIVDMT